MTDSSQSAPQELPAFPVDDGTLSVVRDSLNRTIIGFDTAGSQVYSGSQFGLHDVLNMLSGYDPTFLKPMVNEYDQPIPNIYEYLGGPVYHEHDVIRALIDEIRRLRTSTEQEGTTDE